MTGPAGLHRNHQAFWRHMARAAGGSVEECSGGLLIATGIPAAPFNQLHCGPQGPDGGLLEAAEKHFAARGLPWRIVCEGPSPEAEAFGRARGRSREPLYPILSRPLGADTTSGRAGGLEVTAARGSADLRAFVECAGASYGHDPELIEALVGPAAVADDGFRLYLGRADGRCVAISVGVRDGGTVGVYFVGVRPEFRGRGFGRALTERVLTEGAASGAETAVLQATPAGLPVYTRMGFRQVADYHLLDLPLPADIA